MLNSVSIFIKNVSYNMLADLSNKLVHSVLILMLSYFLGVAAMGSYSIAHTIFSFGLMFSYWGFGNLLTREVARDQSSYSKYLSNFGLMRITLATIVVIITNIFLGFMNYGEITLLTIRIISIGIITNSIVNLIYALFIAFEELKYITAIALTISVIRLVISYIILILGGNITHIAAFLTLSEFLSLIISLVFAFHYLENFQLDFDLDFCIKQFVRAFPFFWIAILVILDSRSEILIISVFFDESAVGYFTAMNTVIGGLALFSEGLRNAVFPLFARYHINDPDQLKKILPLLGKYITLFTIPIAVGVYFLSDVIINFFFQAGYEVSVTLLRIVVWTFVGYSLTVVAIRLLMVLDREKQVVFSLFITAFFTILLNILIAPIIGIIGVATVRLLTTYILFFLSIMFLIQQGYKIINLAVLIRIGFAGILLYYMIYILEPVNLYFGILTGLIIYIGVVWFTRIIETKEVYLWKNLITIIFKKHGNTT